MPTTRKKRTQSLATIIAQSERKFRRHRLKKLTEMTKEEKEKLAVDLARKEYAGARRSCPVCFKNMLITRSGKYPHHGPGLSCPAGGRYVYNNGVVM